MPDAIVQAKRTGERVVCFKKRLLCGFVRFHAFPAFALGYDVRKDEGPVRIEEEVALLGLKAFDIR